jgi:hypothetical protein
MPWNSAMLASTPRSCLAVACIACAQEGGGAGMRQVRLQEGGRTRTHTSGRLTGAQSAPQHRPPHSTSYEHAARCHPCTHRQLGAGQVPPTHVAALLQVVGGDRRALDAPEVLQLVAVSSLWTGRQVPRAAGKRGVRLQRGLGIAEATDCRPQRRSAQ